MESHSWPHVNPRVVTDLGCASHLLTRDPLMLHPQIATLAARIRALIEASDFTQAEIGRALGVDKSTVNKWMTGGRTPTMQNLIELAELLGVDMREIWEGPEAIPTTPEQRLMVEQMARMTPEQQQAFLAMAATMVGKM